MVLHLKITPEKIIAKLQPYFIKEEALETPANSFEEESQEFKTVEDRYPEEEDKAEKEKIEIVLPAAEETLATEEKQTAEVPVKDEEIKIEVKAVAQEDVVETLSQELVEKYGAFDPTLELSGFKFPTPRSTKRLWRFFYHY